MLVLSRRSGETIVIGDDVRVQVLEVRGDVVRLGIDAPRSVSVHREEVYLLVQQANSEAASPAPTAVAALAGLLGATTDSAAAPADSAATTKSGDSAVVELPEADDPAAEPTG